MLALFKLRFRGVDRKLVKSEEISSDYYSSIPIGRARIGTLYFYYRDLGKKYFVPYEYIDRAFIRISSCTEDEFGNSAEYYRLILVHGEKEFANLIFEKRNQIDSIQRGLLEKNPEIDPVYKKS